VVEHQIEVDEAVVAASNEIVEKVTNAEDGEERLDDCVGRAETRALIADLRYHQQ